VVVVLLARAKGERVIGVRGKGVIAIGGRGITVRVDGILSTKANLALSRTSS
jgi:hypothetical protein